MSSGAYAQALSAFHANRMDAAGRHVRDAMIDDPEDPRPRHLAGVMALVAGRLAEAQARFREAIDMSTASADAAASWVGLGRSYLPQGSLEDARNCFQRAVSLSPGLGPAHSGLAAVSCDLGGYVRAEEEARIALRYADDARTRLVLARALLFQTRIDEAEPLLEVLSRDRDVRYIALFHLAGCKAAHGRRSEAEETFRTVLEEQPTYPGHLELARSKVFRQADDPDLGRMRALLDRIPAEPSYFSRVLSVDLCFALAKAYDDLHEFDRAFPYLQRANRIRAQAEPFDINAFRRQVDAVVDTVRALPSPERADFASGPVPLVIAALPRSGSTLLEQMLCAHPAIAGGGEFSPFVPVLQELVNASTSDGASLANGHLLEHARRELLRLLSCLGSGADYLTEKSPVAFVYAGLMGRIFPGTRVIHLVRDPLDTAFSQYRQLFAPGMGWTYDLDLIPRYRAVYESAVDQWRASPDIRYIEVSYEGLVREPRRELVRILEFCGLEWDPSCGDFQNNKRAVWTASGLQVREKLTSRHVGHWRHYAPYLEGLREALAPAVAAYEQRLHQTD